MEFDRYFAILEIYFTTQANPHRLFKAGATAEEVEKAVTDQWIADIGYSTPTKNSIKLVKLYVGKIGEVSQFKHVGWLKAPITPEPPSSVEL